MESTKHCFRHFPRVEGENTTQPWLRASCTFPSWSQEKHCPLALPRSHIIEEPPPPSSQVGNLQSSPGAQDHWHKLLSGHKPKHGERIKTQTCWEWGSSKTELPRRDLHTVHLQSGTSPLYGSSLAPTKGLIFVFHQSHLYSKLPGVLFSTLYSSPLHSWKLPTAERIWQQTRNITFALEMQPASKECRWSHHKANGRPLFQLSKIIHNSCHLASGKILGKHMGYFLYFQLCHTISLSNSPFCCHMMFLWYSTIPMINKLFLKMYRYIAIYYFPWLYKKRWSKALQTAWYNYISTISGMQKYA